MYMGTLGMRVCDSIFIMSGVSFCLQKLVEVIGVVKPEIVEVVDNCNKVCSYIFINLANYNYRPVNRDHCINRPPLYYTETCL